MVYGNTKVSKTILCPQRKQMGQVGIFPGQLEERAKDSQTKQSYCSLEKPLLNLVRIVSACLFSRWNGLLPFPFFYILTHPPRPSSNANLGVKSTPILLAKYAFDTLELPTYPALRQIRYVEALWVGDESFAGKECIVVSLLGFPLESSLMCHK